MIDHLDHLVLTTCNEAACVDFYTRVLGMQLETFVGGTPPVQRRRAVGLALVRIGASVEQHCNNVGEIAARRRRAAEAALPVRKRQASC